ncbi:MAG: VCBS repeat-containing protein [Crocinitomicaceae bacterium]
MKVHHIIFQFICLLVLVSCESKTNISTEENKDHESEKTAGFEPVSPEHSGVTFTNNVVETELQNYYNFEYIYNGAGVATGDINNDGLVDLFFTGNNTSDKLYINKGNLKFEDITEQAFDYDMASGWHTGVNMADVNGDGFLDIYIGQSGNTEKRKELENLLFINNQDNTFSEKGAEFGVNTNRRTTHSVFFDFDNDGDLDLYVLNHPLISTNKNFSNEQIMKDVLEGEDADVIYRNDDGIFYDISQEAGIRSSTYGLGIAASDLNNDGFIDLYISSDYNDPDFLFMNQGNGTFKEELIKQTSHVSNFSMGNEAADFNNDGLVDIVTLDMASEDHIRSKKNMGGMSQENFWNTVNMNFHYQYMFNGLQLNNGNGTFSEIGQLAGISKTDWSWAALLADFDNDGNKDLFVTNGFRREMRDNDYNRSLEQRRFNNQLGNFKDELSKVPLTKIENYVFQNQGDLTFKKTTSEWGLDIPINSNGAAYADLDNDGDLDLVLNNMEDVASIFENKSSGNNYVRFDIEGYEKNTQAIGTKLTLYTKSGKQYQELQVSRGYVSAVEGILHFGLGNDEIIDRIIVQWPDGKVLEKKNLKANQTIEISYAEASLKNIEKSESQKLFADITDSILNFKHKEEPFDDFESEILLPNKLSQSGPFIAKGDVNGDGLEDIYISGPLGETGKLFLQTNSGFKENSGPWEKETKREEMDAVFFDADNDGDLDLYVVSGGNEYYFDSPYLIDQLYVNDGKGNFTNESDRLPQISIGGQRVAVGDYDQDGDMDLFVGGRQIPGYYPYIPKSYLYENDGGYFKDVTANSPDLIGPGLVTDALFDDFDSDGDLDLIVVGEWMPVSFFENNQNKFSNVTDRYNSAKDVGWWYSIEKGDFNGDGKNDYISGNLGENNKFHPSKVYPLELYCHDFDGNGTNDIVLGEYQNNICYPVRGRQCSSQQMPFISEKFPTYGEFATADLSKIYGEDQLEKALHFSATSFSSAAFMSNESSYSIERLPVYCQFGPINKTIVGDFNKDGNLDALVAGNNYGVEVETIRYDGGRGVILLGDGKGNFQQLSPTESGFFENKDCKDMVQLKFNGKNIVITVSNQAKAKTFLLD